MRRSCAPLDTPIGRLWVTLTPAGLAAISRGPMPPADALLDADAAGAVLDELAGYFGGRRRSFDVTLDVRGARPFDVAVWEAARSIPFGQTVSYGELAAMAGSPLGARAAGSAMARCPFSPVVPCHRVIHADGSLGGWGPEPWAKRWLLGHEAAVVSAGGDR